MYNYDEAIEVLANSAKVRRMNATSTAMGIRSDVVGIRVNLGATQADSTAEVTLRVTDLDAGNHTMNGIAPAIGKIKSVGLTKREYDRFSRLLG